MNKIIKNKKVIIFIIFYSLIILACFLLSEKAKGEVKKKDNIIFYVMKDKSDFPSAEEFVQYVQNQFKSIIIAISSQQDQIIFLAQEIDRLKQEINKIKMALPIQAIQRVTVTAYTACSDETDDDPNVTASNSKLQPYDIAISRDLFFKGWVFGKRVYLDQYGVFVIRDLMNERFDGKIDIYFGDKKAALEFGIKEMHAALLND